jgi:hypothetical protein
MNKIAAAMAAGQVTNRRITMKKLLAGAAIALAPFTAALGFAGTANASSPGDQDAASYAAEMNAASRSDGLPDDTTASQARNDGILICGMRSGQFSGPNHRAPFTQRELITQFGDNPSAAVIVTRAEYHFCPEYS